VSVWGLFNDRLRRDSFWIAAFFAATLYQIYWDVFVDWNLLSWCVAVMNKGNTVFGTI
jgi:hypothetical protein